MLERCAHTCDKTFRDAGRLSQTGERRGERRGRRRLSTSAPGNWWSEPTKTCQAPEGFLKQRDTLRVQCPLWPVSIQVLFSRYSGS